MVFVLLGVSLLLAWIGYEFRSKDRALSNVLFAFAGFCAIVLLGAFLDWY